MEKSRQVRAARTGGVLRGVAGRGVLACGVALAVAAGGAWAAESATATGAKGEVRTVAPAGDARRGADLFRGVTRLKNGAMPCIGCHHASGAGPLGGGTFAGDLSDAGTRYDDAEALAAMVGKETPFPAMQAVYGPRALTDAEIADLAAYIAEQKTPAGAGALGFFGLGALGMLILAGLSQLLWRNRLTGVRRQLTGGR